jgi:hypothetical protein
MGRKHATLQMNGRVHSSAHNLDWAGAHIRYSDTPRSGSGALMESRPSASTRWQREVTTATAPSAQPAAVMHGEPLLALMQSAVQCTKNELSTFVHAQCVAVARSDETQAHLDVSLFKPLLLMRWKSPVDENDRTLV